MLIKGIIEEDFTNYKKPSMYIAFPKCSFKCDRECGQRICQNSPIAKQENIEVSYEEIVNRYMNNGITKAFVFCGLEPLDSFYDVVGLIGAIREKTDDDIVIYTGYYGYEKNKYVQTLKSYKNIIMKFGRYIPNKTKVFDPVLGVNLASENQYAIKIS